MLAGGLLLRRSSGWHCSGEYRSLDLPNSATGREFFKRQSKDRNDDRQWSEGNTVDVAGTYTAEMAPGSGTMHNDANYRLRAAVIETAKGNYFLKLVGPAKTVARWDQSYTDYHEII